MRPELLEHSAELFEEAEIEYWVLGYRDVQKYAAELRRAATSRLVLTPESDEQRAERVLSQAIREVFTAPQRRGLQRRLEETAYIFLRTERPQAGEARDRRGGRDRGQRPGRCCHGIPSCAC